MTSPDVQDVRDPELPGRLLVVERDALVPLLRAGPEADFALPTAACLGWSVRDVLAHCSAALMRGGGEPVRGGGLLARSNARDIAEGAGWTNAQVVEELERGMTEAGPVIANAGGALDGVALGEWVHAGDVRGALVAPGPYAGAGLPDALRLLAWLSRQRRHIPLRGSVSNPAPKVAVAGGTSFVTLGPPGLRRSPGPVRLFAGGHRQYVHRDDQPRSR